MSDFPGLVQALQLAIKSTSMYTGAHPRAQASLGALAEQLRPWLEARPALHIAASAGKVFQDGSPVDAMTVHMKSLLRQFDERQISGFILQRGVSQGELEAMVEILLLKPARIDEGGGAMAILSRRGVQHIQISQTQYREVREGEGGEDDNRGPATGSAAETEAARAAAAAAALAALAESALAAAAGQGEGEAQDARPGAEVFNLELLTDQWEEQLDLLPRPSLLEGGGFAPAQLGYLAGTPLSAGMGEGFPPAEQIEGLRRALLGLAPETLLSVVAGLESLPAAPSGVRMGFQALANQAFAKSGADLLASGLGWDPVREALAATLQSAPQQQAMLAALEAELQSRGLGLEILERFRELVQQLDWESLPMEEKVRLALHGHLWILTVDQRLAFLRQLLVEGRTETFLTLLDQVLERLAGEDPRAREAAAHTLAGVTRWLEVPGLPLEAEGPLFQGLTAHFGWEPHLHIHQPTTSALDGALDALVSRGEPGQALALLRELDSLCDFQDTPTPWRDEALASLWRRLASPGCLRKVVELLHTATPETMLGELIPYLESAGESACRLLVEMLEEEPDRKRRARIIEAIRGLGDQALPALFAGLDSPTWFLVRNTLNLLADLGDASALPAIERCLTHPDGRVKRAAIRALWKAGGPTAVAPLLGIFPGEDPETQMEILFALGQVHSPLSVPVLSAFAQDKRHPLNLRSRACETLGQIGDPRAIPALAETAQRKGRIFTSAEPPELRVAACTALRAIGTTSALEALRALVAAEPASKDRALLQQVLEAAP